MVELYPESFILVELYPESFILVELCFGRVLFGRHVNMPVFQFLKQAERVNFRIYLKNIVSKRHVMTSDNILR